MDEKTCVGCNSYNEEYPHQCLAEVRLYQQSKCPCIQCVIKSMCNKPCEPFDKIRPEELLTRGYIK